MRQSNKNELKVMLWTKRFVNCDECDVLMQWRYYGGGEAARPGCHRFGMTPFYHMQP